MNTKHHYLRLLRTFALAALTAAATAACTDDNGDPDGREPITPDDANPGIPVTFTANINPGSDANPAAAPGTRTILTPTAEGGFTVTWKGMDNNHLYNPDKIRIRAAKGTTVIPDRGTLKIYNPTTSAASSPLEPVNDQNKLTLTEGGLWTFTAVYGSYVTADGEPYSNLLDGQDQLQPGNTDHIAKLDFSVATATQNIAAADMPQDISLGFKHLLSALQLHVTNQTGEAFTVREIRLSVDGDQIAYQRYYDIATGDWKTTGEQKAAYLQLDAINFPALPSDGTAQDLHMLFFPGYENETLTVTVITDRGEYSRTKGAPDKGFAAGHNYLTDITIKTSGLDPNTETWTETISTAEELKAFRDRVNNGNTYDGVTVRLTANIDLANETWTPPIGTDASKPFKGTFDGGGHLISNLNVNYGSNSYAGLFGWVDGGTVRNLRVSGTVTTGYYVGGIAGCLNSNCTVENCIFEGTVSGKRNVGGIAGYSIGASRIAGCHTKGTVTITATSSDNAGGIAGYNAGSAIDDCYSEAEVKGGYLMTGGIAGSNESGTVTHCYATGKVSGKSDVGGIVGYQDKGTVTGCIALNPGLTRTEGTETIFGRIVGNNVRGTITSCAAYDGMTIKDAGDNNIYADATGEHGTALTAAQCLTAAAYTTRGFTEATATTPGWAFDAAATWADLPWNPAFENFLGITETNQYRIAVPSHLGGGTN